ncbi:MAG: protoporphyrinogen oxidase [Prevotella sp.]|nr:protoporphyrinogen oxidase [Prevotella sp.]
MERQRKTVVIGAGLTGLTCAFHLCRKGEDVEVLEAADRIGGLMQTDEVEGFIMEQGPSTGTIKHPEVAELFEELGSGCKLEVAQASAKCRLIWKDGRFRALPSGLVSAVMTPLFTLKDKFRILGEPWRKRGTDPDESVGSLAERRLGKSFVDYAVDPFLSGVYAGDPYRLPTRLALPKLYNLEQNYGSFIRGTFALARQPKTARDRRATKEVFSTRGGFRNLVDALGAAIGKNRITTGCASLRVEPCGRRWRLSWGGDTIVADHVITTCPAYALPDLLGFLPASQLAELSNLYYAPVIEIGVGVRHTGCVRWDAFGGLVPSCERQEVLGILMPSACFANRAPEGGVTYAYFIGGARHPEYLDRTDAELTELVNTSLHSMLGYPEGTKADVIRIYRHRHAIPQYMEGTDKRILTIREVEQTHPGLHIIGNLKDGIGMGDRIKQAVDMAESIVGHAACP